MPPYATLYNDVYMHAIFYRISIYATRNRVFFLKRAMDLLFALPSRVYDVGGLPGICYFVLNVLYYELNPR